MKKICFFINDITTSGGTERVGTIISNQISNNEQYKVSIVSLCEKLDAPSFHISSDIDRYSLFTQPVKGLTNIHRICYRLIKLIKKEKFEIIIDIDGILDAYSLVAKFFTGVKVISWEHLNFYQHMTVGHRRYTRWLAGRFADAIVTLTDEDRGYYLSNLKIKCPIKVIYNPITEIDHIYDYDCNSKMILSVGRLVNVKGFDMLVDIAKEVFAKNPDWTWIVLGEGEERPLLEKKIKDYGLEEKLILYGNVNNVEDFYKNASILVMTSRHEGLPMVLLEIKPYQIPAVSFDIKTGPKECIIDGINGYLVTPFDKLKMAHRINELIEDEAKRLEFSKNVLRDTQKFSLKNVVKEWEHILNSL